MNVDKMTIRVQQALNDANLIAVKYNHQQIEVIHLFAALVEQEDGLIPNILTKMNVDVRGLKSTLNRTLDNMPKVLGEGANSSGVYITRKVEEVLIKAEELAKKFEDSYISVEHLMLAILDKEKSGAVGDILKSYSITEKNFMKVLSEVRGSQRVETNAHRSPIVSVSFCLTYALMSPKRNNTPAAVRKIRRIKITFIY